DTTFSMNGEFTGLKSTLPTIIDSLKTRLPDLGIGIAGHDDIPTAKYSRCFAPTYACPSGFTCYRYGFVGNEWCTPNANDFGSCARPRVMEISAAEFHDGVPPTATRPGAAPAWCIYAPAGTTCTTGAYSQTETYPFSEATISGLATAMKAKGARFLGGAADD